LSEISTLAKVPEEGSGSKEKHTRPESDQPLVFFDDGNPKIKTIVPAYECFAGKK
jgi:hypothetical protein